MPIWRGDRGDRWAVKKNAVQESPPASTRRLRME